MKILVAEGDDALRARIVTILKRGYYLAEETDNGEEALFLGEQEQFVAIVLDLGLPVLDGLTVLRRWREQRITTPVLVLTARDTWRDKVDGLRAGADDYLGKPFEGEELLARIEALIRRAYGRAEPVLNMGRLEIDPAQRGVRFDGANIDLTAMEFRLLHYLVLNAGKVIGQEELIQHIYSQDIELNSNVIEVIVSRLRKKIYQNIIQTKRGHGYVVSTSI